MVSMYIKMFFFIDHQNVLHILDDEIHINFDKVFNSMGFIFHFSWPSKNITSKMLYRVTSQSHLGQTIRISISLLLGQ